MDDSLSDDSGEDDPVTHEIDVYLAKALAERLYLFQYPVRPSCLSYDEIPHLAARIKPKQQKVELELELNTSSARYCLPRGEQIAYAVDEAAPASSLAKGPYYQSGSMDKQVLTSVRAAENASRYVAGVFKNGTLSLTPVHGFVQLRPSFEYLDRADDNKQTTSSAKMDEDKEEEEEEAKPVMTRFARVETDKSIEKKKQSFNSIEQKLAEEPWTEIRYYPTKSRAAISEKMLLQCHQQDFESPEFTATSREYLNILTPKHEGAERHPTALPHGVLSMASLKKMDLADQIKALLINAKVIYHHHLLSLLGPSVDEKTIIKGLHNYGILVQGCWVVKSEVMYPKGSKSNARGIDAESIWPGRDYVLWRFNHKRLLERKDIISTVRIPGEELRDMLEQVARQKPPHGWEFMLPTDTDFLHKHPEVVKSQLQVWKAKAASLKQNLHLPKEYASKEDDVLPGLDASLHSKTRVGKPRIKSRDSTDNKRKRGSGTEDEKSPSKMNLTASDSDKNDIKPKTIDSGVVNSEINGVRIKTEPLDHVKVEVDDPMEQTEFQEIQDTLIGIEMVIDSDNEIRTTNHDDDDLDSNKNASNNAFVPPAASGKTAVSVEKPPSEIFIQELNRFITETLKGGCLSMAEIKEILSIRQQEPGNILCSGVSDDLLENQILKVGASELTIKWPEDVRVSEEKKKVYAFRKTGDQRDNYRQVVLDMFSETFSNKRADILSILKEKFGSAPSNHMFPRFMGEFCEKYGTAWYLRGTYKAAYPNR